jgi:hypothetical protein
VSERPRMRPLAGAMAGVIVGVVAGVVGAALPAAAQVEASLCADCHISRPDMPNARHVSDWDQSPHARAGIGCDGCHGGNPATAEPFLAHQGILRSSNPASPVSRANLPATCGTCHAGPYAAFQRSRHHALLAQGSSEAPTCATCHGEVASALLSPRQLERRCASCHGPDRVAPHPTFAADARLMLEGVREARGLLDDARSAIGRVSDSERRLALQADAARAAAPLTDATHAGHAFVFDDLRERLATARERIAALYDRLLHQGR